MSTNNVTSSDIVLVKWNGNSWIELETRILSKDDTNTFFEGKTNAFSPFAITVKMSGVTAKVPGLEIPQQVEAKTLN
ncbi:MAG: PGF-pre-PGF domain-containing protein, partial [Candidatus Methanoperedens sp.]|nr:PGF-pre-PGF domain-containing protein [Candidatus Methanoperedens sp.]